MLGGEGRVLKSFLDYLCAYLSLLLVSSMFVSTAYCDSESSGQNTLRPVRRVDLRHEYENLEGGAEKQRYILRAEEKFQINENLNLAFRADIPSVTVDREESFSSGIGDILLQSLLIEKINHRWRHTCGIRTIVPTASTDATGGEKWDIVPIVGWSVDTPELGHGSFSSLLMRYRFSTIGANSRKDRNRLEIDFDINFHLPNQWFVELTSEPVLDFENRNKWVLPVGLEFGRKIGESFIFSFEPQLFIVDDASDAQFVFESRIGIFF